MSSTVTHPCALVWELCQQMQGQPRKTVIAACVAAGVAFGTARTQYQLWYTANKASTPPIPTPIKLSTCNRVRH